MLCVVPLGGSGRAKKFLEILLRDAIWHILKPLLLINQSFTLHNCIPCVLCKWASSAKIENNRFKGHNICHWFPETLKTYLDTPLTEQLEREVWYLIGCSCTSNQLYNWTGCAFMQNIYTRTPYFFYTCSPPSHVTYVMLQQAASPPTPTFWCCCTTFKEHHLLLYQYSNRSDCCDCSHKYCMQQNS